MPRSNFLGGMLGLAAVALVVALVLGCKQRTLNDQGQQKAISGLVGGRASFLWPVVRKRGNAVTDLDSCWYTASAPLPVGAGEDYRFPVSEVRKLFETSTPIPEVGARYRLFSEYQQAASLPGNAAALKFAGTLAICSATALGPVANVFTNIMKRQSIRPGKPGLIVLGIGALLCGGSLFRAIDSNPKSSDQIPDATVGDDFQKYLAIAFNEDYRVEFREYLALEKAIASVVRSAPSPAARRFADPCPAPADALKIVEGSFK